jgi:hypothetical protein
MVLLVWRNDMRLHIPDRKNADRGHGALQSAQAEKEAGRKTSMCILHWLMISMAICLASMALESGKRRKEKRMDRAAVQMIRMRNWESAR